MRKVLPKKTIISKKSELVASEQSKDSVGSMAGKQLPWSPWVAVVFIVVLFYLSQVIGSLIISIYPALRHWTVDQANTWANNSVWATFVYVAIAESLTFGGIYVFLRRFKISLGTIGLRRFQWTDPLWALTILPVYYITYVLLVNGAHVLIPALNVNQQQQLGFNHVVGAGSLIVTFISLVILPPIVEEIMFRGFLYSSLKKGLPQVVAALVTSLIFASAHLQVGSGAPLLWVAFMDTFILSLFLIYLREKTKGLYASMTLHALKNFISFVIIFIFHIT